MSQFWIKDSAVKLVWGRRCCRDDWQQRGGKTEGTYCTGLGWGNELFLAGASESTTKARLGTERKTALSEGFRGGGKERCFERRVHKGVCIDLTPLPLTCGWGDDFSASRCRPTLRVFTVPWCVCNMLGPPVRTWPALLERWWEKAHVREFVFLP